MHGITFERDQCAHQVSPGPTTIIAAETVNTLPSRSVSATGVVTAIGAVMLARLENVAFEKCFVAPSTTTSVSDTLDSSKASAIDD